MRSGECAGDLLYHEDMTQEESLMIVSCSGKSWGHKVAIFIYFLDGRIVSLPLGIKILI